MTMVTTEIHNCTKTTGSIYVACTQWTIQKDDQYINQSFFDKLDSLTSAQVGVLFSSFASVFVVAWGWKQLSRFFSH